MKRCTICGTAIRYDTSADVHYKCRMHAGLKMERLRASLIRRLTKSNLTEPRAMLLVQPGRKITWDDAVAAAFGEDDEAVEKIA